MKRVFLALALVPLSGCIWDPANRTNQQSTASITVDGFAPAANAVVTLSATNLNDGTVVSLGTATAASSPMFTTPYALYYWSTTITPAANLWSPQSVMVNGQAKALNGLPESAGRLEFTASSSGMGPYASFSPAAKSCVTTHMNNGDSAVAAGNACTDGSSVAVFDNDGVGNGAPATGWVTDYNHPSPPPGVAWELGHYVVQGKNIYGYLCRPTSPGLHKAVIINHGGYGPLGAFALDNYCIASAQQGWVTAMSGYRGEQVMLPTGLPLTSGGNIEVCQGEVTDVLRLTEIIHDRADVDDAKVLMWGHSHGACITARAVQRGAQVKAAAIFAPPTDMAAWYGYIDAVTQAQLALSFGIPSQNFSVTPAQSLIPYDWRSPVKYKDDLAARTDVKLLILQGTADPMIHPSQACSLASGSTSLNWHFQNAGNPPNPAPTPTSAEPTDCDPHNLTWQSGSPPYGTWPDSRYLLVYEGEDHGTILDITRPPWLAFANWVNTIFP